MASVNLSSFQHKLEKSILDPRGVHHEFAYGTHGQKLDFDLIKTGSPLYNEWVCLNTAVIRQRFPRPPFAVLGVANGTNRLARDVATALGDGVVALFTRKVSPREVRLTDVSRSRLIRAATGLIIVLEDVGTSGGTAHSAVRDAQLYGRHDFEGQFSWQRTGELEAFAKRKMPYHALICEPLPTYKPADCATRGFCADGWELIPHGRSSAASRVRAAAGVQ